MNDDIDTTMKIKLTECGRYKDGGTIKLKGNNGKFYFQDGRIGSTTKGELFDKYPDEKGAKQLDKKDFLIAKKETVYRRF